MHAQKHVKKINGTMAWFSNYRVCPMQTSKGWRWEDNVIKIENILWWMFYILLYHSFVPLIKCMHLPPHPHPPPFPNLELPVCACTLRGPPKKYLFNWSEQQTYSYCYCDNCTELNCTELDWADTKLPLIIIITIINSTGNQTILLIIIMSVLN